MDEITLTIDDVEIKTNKGKRILEAALENGIYIPNLCALRDIRLPTGACRLCQVQIEGKRGTVTACSEPAADGMVIHSNTSEVNSIRRTVLEIMLAKHPYICLTCHRRERCKPGDICLRLTGTTDQQCILCPNNARCELQKAVDFIGMDNIPYPYKSKELPIERDNPFIVRNNNLCILCGRCVRVCQEVLGIEAIAFNLRGIQTFIGGAFGKPLTESGCTFCGSCVEVCPTGALMDRGDEWDRWPDRVAASIRCQYACPARVDVPRFIRFIREGKYTEATAVLNEKVPFAYICSLICSHPCENTCRRGELDQPVAIKALERFVTERSDSSQVAESPANEISGKKVAIIGSGPTGLTAAYYLAKKGRHTVTVFESSPEPGGMMRYVVPEFMLPQNILEAEINKLNNLGIQIRTQRRIESTDELFKEGYDAVLIATGAQQGARIGIDGEDTSGVIDGLSFLKEINSGQQVKIGRKVAVIGNGNIAVYASRTALRLGCKEVTIISSMTEKAISSEAGDIAAALNEGVALKPCLAPCKISGTAGKLKLECLPVSQGRTVISGNPVINDVDNIIVAVGVHPDISNNLTVTSTDVNNIITAGSEKTTTDQKGVFIGGGIVEKAFSFIDGVASGRQAAKAIDLYLGGNGDISEVLAPISTAIPKIGRMDNFVYRQRQVMPLLTANNPDSSFKQTELGFTDEAGSEEAMRCMGCDLRFAIGDMVASPEYKAAMATLQY